MAWKALEVDWSFAAIAELLKLPRGDAERADAAVQRYAATGRGRVTRRRGEPYAGYLHVGRYKIRFRVDAKALRLLVVYVWRRDWGPN